MGVGLVAGAACALAVRMKYRFGYDDALDVVGVHLCGGLVGGVLIGLFASPASLGGEFDAGLIEGGGLGLLLEQIFANVVVGVFAFVVTYIIIKALDATIGLRVDEDTERIGLDTTLHAEAAYT